MLVIFALDSLRDKILSILLERNIQLKYRMVLPDAFPMPKPEYLHPTFDKATWDQLVAAYLEALESLREQAVKEAENPPKRDPPWYRKNSDTGLIETV